MARRPLKRVFGETSIELKCLILFGAFLLLVISASFLSYWVVTENVVEEQNPNTGRLLAQQSMVAMHWLAFESKEKGNERFLAVARYLTREVTDKEIVPEAAGNPKIPNERESRVRYMLPDETQPPERQPKDKYERDQLRDFLKTKPDEPGKADHPAFARAPIPIPATTYTTSRSGFRRTAAAYVMPPNLGDRGWNWAIRAPC